MSVDDATLPVRGELVMADYDFHRDEIRFCKCRFNVPVTNITSDLAFILISKDKMPEMVMATNHGNGVYKAKIPKKFWTCDKIIITVDTVKNLNAQGYMTINQLMEYIIKMSISLDLTN